MVFAYSYAVIILAWYFVDHINQHIWLKAGLFISVLFLLFVFLTPSLAGNFSKSPFKHNLGWPELNQLLKKLEFDENRNFLISDKYQISSISSFYNPAKKLSYFLNLRGSRRNQFCYWPSYQLAEKDKVGYFLWVENQPYLDKELLPAEQFYVSELPKYFETVEKLGFFPLITEKKRVVKGVLIFKCQGIKELQPKDSTLF